jgi:hypothetical protein
MKAMSLTMQIIIVVVVLLIAAMVVLTIYGGQMGGIAAQLQQWTSGVGSPTSMQTCQNLTGTCFSPTTQNCTGSVNFLATGCSPGQQCCIGTVA